MLTLNMRNQLRSGRWLLLAMLWLLHGALLLGVENTWAHAPNVFLLTES
jgi:hypothetical protein